MTMTAARDEVLLEAARTLAPKAAARSLEIEQARTLPSDLVAELRDHGLFRLAMPASLGGEDVSPRTVLRIVEEFAAADGATGWCLLIGNIGNAFLAWLDDDAAKRIVGSTPDIIVAGGQAPLGQAWLEPDGSNYRVRGRWPFGSGCLHANWFTGGFIVMDGDRPKVNSWGMPEMRVGYFPASDATVEDTWHVAGLAGTGSNDILAEDILIPAERTMVPYFDRAGVDEPLYRLTAYNLLLSLMSAFPLGVTRRALSEADIQLRAKTQLSTGRPLIEDPEVQVTFLRHDTAARAARRHVLDTLDELLDELADGDRPFASRARLAAAIIHAYDVGRQAAQDLFRLAGAGVLLDTNPLQRCMRDLVAGSQHVAFSYDSRKRIANALLGLQDRPVFFGV